MSTIKSGRSTRGFGLLILSGAITVLATGCSEEPAAGSTAGDSSEAVDLTAVRACELLTAGEIEDATGVAPGTPQDVTQAGGALPMCNWPRAQAPAYDTFVNVLVTRHLYDNYDEFIADARASPLGDSFAEDAVQAVTGAGDFAVWMIEAGMLQVYEGDVMVQVTAETAAGRDQLEAAKELALAAHAKLN